MRGQQRVVLGRKTVLEAAIGRVCDMRREGMRSSQGTSGAVEGSLRRLPVRRSASVKLAQAVD